MFKTTKTIITAVLLLLTIGLFSQETTDDKAIVKDANGISTGMTKAQYDQFKKDYYNKMEKLGMYDPISPSKTYFEWQEKNPQMVQEYKQKHLERMLFNRININAVDEFKKIGIDLVKASQESFLKTGNCDIEKRILTSDIIVVGVAIDSLIILNSADNVCFNSVCKIKIEEFLAGKKLFNDNVPEVITYYSTLGAPGWKPQFRADMGKKMIYMFDSARRSYQTMATTLKYCTTPELKRFPLNFDDQTVQLEGTKFEIDKLPEIRQKVQQIKAINKADDFYRRKY